MGFAQPRQAHATASQPAALAAEPNTPDHEDYAAFLRRMLPQQKQGVASYRLGRERVWLKKAGPRHSRWRYRLLALIAHTLRLDTLTPVPNFGGEQAIATESRRLRTLAESGLRVPRVLAESPEGLLISDMGQNGRSATVFNERLEQAASHGPVALLSAWEEGLAAIAAVHARGAYLSQAFARNMMQCPDGVIGFIDFEDDPGETLSIAECQARDWLSYLHSTALPLRASKPEGAGEAWHKILAQADPAVRKRLAQAALRVRWLCKLPADRRWGRDTQRVRAVARLLTQWYPQPDR